MSSFYAQPDFGIPGSARLRAIVSGASSSQASFPAPDNFRYQEFSEVVEDIDAEPLGEWNKGVFSETLLQFGPQPEKFQRPGEAPARAPRFPILPLYKKIDVDKSVLLGARLRLVSPPALTKGTLNGTKVAATEVYKRILQRHSSYFDTANFEPSAPQPTDLKKKQSLYTWQLPNGPGDYPPHLAVIPNDVKANLIPGVALAKFIFWRAAGWVIPKNVMDIINRFLPDSDIPPIDAIFNAMRLLDTAVLLGQVFPEEIIDWVNFSPDQGATMASITARNADLVRERKGIYTVANIGSAHVDDWFTDALFAQQHLNGPNPCTLELANANWIAQFRREAEIQNKTGILQVINEAMGKSSPELYIQDYSYFRKAIKVPAGQTMSSQPQSSAKGKGLLHTDSSDKIRFAVASVCLFHLEPTTGRLHPLAIIIDYMGSFENSVVIFNQRLRESDSSVDQTTDWPWRYAKTCVQISDWTRHEVTVHLVHTHFIEEAVIVAANRSFESNHPVYKLLSPHWIKTLSLNAAARTTLVPDVVIKLSGMTTAQLMLFIQDAYSTFDWQENYIPTDLERRGFPVAGINDPKFRNCGYARNMHVLWQILQTFVGDYLDASGFTTDTAVAQDKWIQRWCMEMTSINPSNGRYYPGASIKNFPFIKTRKQLIDAVTMCIHIASPQHTAVNYLQEYYQTFVVNKPPALYTAPVQSLGELMAMNEKKFMNALPIAMPREWLLASHLPHLLNMTVAKEQNLVNYAKSVYESVKSTDGVKLDDENERIKKIAENFWTALMGFSKVIDRFNEAMDNDLPPYVVLKPDVTAVSILI